MQTVKGIDMDHNSREEQLPGFSPEFPYIATCAELDAYGETVVPWHWHRTVELFYVKSGSLEYSTPGEKWIFPAGSGGMVNSNVLHSSEFSHGEEPNIQLLHLFDPTFLSGEAGSRMEKKYILPLTTDKGIPLIPLYPEEPAQCEILREIQELFGLSESQWGYEFTLRESLSKIWLKLFDLAKSEITNTCTASDTDDKIKTLLVYIHEHFASEISVEKLANRVHISQRACFRLFQECLHMTPGEYILDHRLRCARQMLMKTQDSVTKIAGECGFGTSSYFGVKFRERYGCTPSQYRKCWQNYDKN